MPGGHRIEPEGCTSDALALENAKQIGLVSNDDVVVVVEAKGTRSGNETVMLLVAIFATHFGLVKTGSPITDGHVGIMVKSNAVKKKANCDKWDVLAACIFVVMVLIVVIILIFNDYTHRN